MHCEGEYEILSHDGSYEILSGCDLGIDFVALVEVLSRTSQLEAAGRMSDWPPRLCNGLVDCKAGFHQKKLTFLMV